MSAPEGISLASGNTTPARTQNSTGTTTKGTFTNSILDKELEKLNGTSFQNWVAIFQFNPNQTSLTGDDGNTAYIG